MEVYPNLKPGTTELAGGAGFQLVLLGQGLQPLGYEPSYVVGDFGQDFHEVVGGFPTYRANKVAYDRSVTRGLKNMWRLFKAMRAAGAGHYVLRSTRFLSFFVMLYARLLGAKYTFMVANLPHCLRDELESLPWVFRQLYLLSVKLADRITVQTREQQELFEKNFGVRAPVVPNGIPVPPIEPAETDFAYDFVWVASFKIQKRADKLIEIAQLLPHRRFLVVGGPGQDEKYSRDLMDKVRRLPNVEYRGFVTPDKVGDVYREGRIYLNTSDWEGFPNGFLYAWSRGIPACSLHIDPDGSVSAGDLGIVDPSPQSLAVAMDGLLDDPRRYDAMAARCYAHVQESHSLNSTVATFISVLPT